MLAAIGLSSPKADKAPTPSATALSDDAQWLAANGNDPKAIDDRFGTKAEGACASGAGDYLSKLAAYDYKWDSEADGWLGTKFDKFLKASPGAGLITYTSSHAMLSNGFGAFQHVPLYCLYDAAADKVVRFSQLDPSIDLDADTGENEIAPAAPPPALGNGTWINRASDDNTASEPTTDEYPNPYPYRDPDNAE